MSEFEFEPVIEERSAEPATVYTRPAWVEVDLDAIRHNARVVRREVGDGTLVMAVVKADGYGHGAVRVAGAAIEEGVDWLGVALPEEGVELRKSGIGAPTLVLAEPPATAARLMVENDLSATVCSKETAAALDEEAGRAGKIAALHLKVDTGMNRIGVAPDEAPGLIDYILSLPSVRLEGVFTHFAKADDPSSDLTVRQMELFRRVVSRLPEYPRPIVHAANSAGAFLHPSTRLDMVRIGIALYGLNPSAATEAAFDLKPAFSLKARPSFIKTVGAGEGVSYGHTRSTERSTRLVTVPIGYGDGYTRRLSKTAEVLVGGERRPVIGVICMDQFMVDVGEEECFPEDEVVLIGRQGAEEITVDEVARRLGTINYEVVCMINKRVPRIYLNENS